MQRWLSDVPRKFGRWLLSHGSRMRFRRLPGDVNQRCLEHRQRCRAVSPNKW